MTPEQFLPGRRKTLQETLADLQRGIPPEAPIAPYDPSDVNATPAAPPPLATSGFPGVGANPVPAPKVEQPRKLSDILQERYDQLSAPLTAKQTLLQAIGRAAPIAIGGLLGGTTGAYGASQGVQQNMANQVAQQTERRKELQTQLEAEKNREERGTEREMTTEEQRRGHEERLKGIEEQIKGRQDVADLQQQVKAMTATQANAAKTAAQQATLDATMQRAGFQKDETGKYIPTPAKEAKDKAETAYKEAVTTHQQAMAEYEKSRNDPNSPAFKLAQQRLMAASGNLDLRRREYEMHAFGTAGGQVLPGAMLTDQGIPVGSVNAANVRPTGQERNKGDMAKSASEQLADIRQIIQKRPDVFGPVAGRKTSLEAWIGSEDPDAKAFMSARDIASGHLAGTFGARGAKIVQDLQDSIARFKDNPAAALAGLAQVEKATKQFEKAGTVNTAGSKPPLSQSPKPGDTKTFTSGPNKGKTATWDGIGWKLP